MRIKTPLTKATFIKEGEASCVALPHTWNAFDGQDGGNDYYRGECKYEISLPAPTPGKRQYVEFLGVGHKATVFCNGRLLGEHKGAFSTFRFDLTEHMKKEENLLTVLASNEKGNLYPQTADFTFFGGIYRKAFFIETSQAHFDLLKDGTDAIFVTPYSTGLTRVDLFPVNSSGCEIKVTLSDAEGAVVAETTVPAEEGAFCELVVPTPHLWDGMKDPYLYKASATLLKDGEALDQVETRYGYRSFRVCPEKGFFLNGKSLPLRGVCRHQDREDMGWAISEKEHREDMEMICEIGANTIRLAHYQHDPFFYDLCDELGFVIWAEIPYISLHIAGPEARENTLSQMKELVAQNYNRPSICFWGISNEISIGGFCEEQHQNLRLLNALVKKLDPSRLTTMAQLSSVPVDSIHNHITDVVSYNIYYGWYRGSLEDNGKEMDLFHATHPDKAYGISEYGVDHLTCWHSATPFNHDYTEEYACLYHHHMLKCFAERDYLWATHVWNMFDFAVDHRGEGGIKGRNCKGLVSYDRKTKKDSFYIYKAFWAKEKMVHIAGRRFRDRAPEERDVQVFTNGDVVSLYLNGALLEEKPAVDHVALFEKVPLLLGENTLTAKIDGAEDTIVLCGTETHNTDYDLPDIAAAMEAGNWFLKEREEKDWGDEGYNLDCTIRELVLNEAVAQILRGWIMNNPRMNLGAKLDAVGRLVRLVNSPSFQKKMREYKVFQENFVEEEFLDLEKRIRCVKRV